MGSKVGLEDAKPEGTGLSESQRMVNFGIEIQLKHLSGATVRVRELSLENVVLLASELVQIISSLDLKKTLSTVASVGNDTEAAKKDGFAFLATLLREPNLVVAVQSVAAASISDETRRYSGLELKGMGVADWMKWMTAFKKVTDWEEMRGLFLELLPPGGLSGLLEGLRKKQANVTQGTQSATS